MSVAGGSTYLSTTVATDGTYAVTGLVDGSYTVRLFPSESSSDLVSGYYPGLTANTGPASTVVVSGANAVTGIDFTTMAGGTITGTVTVPAGHTTGNLSVYAQDTVNSLYGSYYGGVANDGSLRISGLRAGTYRVNLMDFGPTDLVMGYYPGSTSSSSATLLTVSLGATTPHIDFDLVVGGAITGKVTVPSGSTTSGLSATATSLDGRSFSSRSIAADGTYSITGLPAGSFKVQLTGWGTPLLLGYYPGQTTSSNASAVVVAARATVTGIDFSPVVGGTISGKVTTPAGIPTSGLTVTANFAGSTYSSTTSSTPVNADGSYTVTGLTPGSYRVRLSGASDSALVPTYYPGPSTGYNDASLVSVTAGSATTGINFAPVLGGTITGTVTVPAGYAVTSLQVAASGPGGSGSATPAADGSYTIRGLGGGAYRVYVSLMGTTDLLLGYFPGQTTYDSATPVTVTAGTVTGAIDFALKAGGTISGKVTVPADTSASGLTVSVSGPTSRSATVASDGTYTVTGLSTGAYLVRLAPGSNKTLLGGYYPGQTTVDAATPVAVTAGQPTTGIDFAPVVGGSISGTVTVPAGHTVDGLTVSVGDPATSNVLSTSVANDGTYTVTGLATGSYLVSVDGNAGDLVVGYYPGSRARVHAQAVPVTASTTTTNIDFALAATGGSIAGRVTMPAGRSISSTHVVVESASADTQLTADPEADGSYAVTGLRPGRYRVRLAADVTAGVATGYYPGLSTYAASAFVTVAAASVTTGIDFAPAQTGTITGVLTTAAGAPVAGASVSASSVDGSFGAYGSSDSSGRFTMSAVTPGSYRIRVQIFNGSPLHSGFAPSGSADESAAQVYTVPAGGTATVSSTVRTSATISGRVTNSSGVGVSGVSVNAGSDNGSGYATTRSDGTYSITSGISGGTYLVSFLGSGTYASEFYADASTSATATTVSVAEGGTRTGVDAVLGVAGSISVTALDPTTHQPVAVGPQLLDASGTWDGPSFDSGGDMPWEAGGLRAGAVKVAFARSSADTPYVAQYYQAPSSTTTSLAAASDVTITAGGATSVTATLQTGAQITGKVVDTAGDPVVGYEVVAFVDDESLASRYTHTRADGTYAITGLLPGRYQVAVPRSNLVGDDTFYGSGVKPSSPNVTVTGTSTTAGIDITVETPFVDIQPGASFASDITWLGGKGITKPGSDGQFGPGGPVQRAAMAAFLYRAAGSPPYTPPTTSPFSDVKTTDAFYKEMSWLSSTGVTKPGADGRFGPNDPVNRSAMAAFLYRFAGSPAYTAPTTSGFSDVKTTDGFYKEMSWLAAQGITKPGADGRFAPVDPVRREAMAAFLHRADTAGILGGWAR
ncbi:MAG: carboxypeptidase regulatory-like domain-containing protein [Actinobacteria bacterium]|nr:carboxypeptidase regulatory-like domain-containing protein [Actinomycetota bacterium]